MAHIGNITSDFVSDLTEIRFINEFKPKILQVGKEKLEKQSEVRDNDKSFYIKGYQKKISVQDAGKKFQKLKTQIKEI